MLGRANVNTATREQLLSIPGVDAALADEILKERAVQPITDVATLPGLPEEARARLKTEGATDLRRIRQLPLVRFEDHVAARQGSSPSALR